MSAADRVRARPDIYGHETATALADLLDAINDGPTSEWSNEYWIGEVKEKTAALEAVIERRLPGGTP